MADLKFWGKPGCAGNARQMALLRDSGHTLDVRDLREEPWTPERLRPFFGNTPVADWFNRSAPAVKRGELRLETLTEPDAMALLLKQPLLIRRPLLECDGITVAGFDPDLIAAWIGLTSGLPSVGEGCPRPDMPSCQPPLQAKQEHISE